jgi:hypothetical protein
VNLLKLSKCDNKLVKIKCTNEEIIEGICIYNNEEYNEHEFGRKEEGIQIENFLFYKTDIKKIEIIDEFSSDYGTLEELIVKEGIDSISDVLYGEEDIHVYRLLRYLNDYFKTNKKESFPHLNTLIRLLNKLLTYNEKIDKDKESKIKNNEEIKSLLIIIDN